eukprot:gene7766-8612_t
MSQQRQSCEAFVLKDPVWSIIVSNTYEKERQEIKTLIGESLVEEISDLHKEAKSLLDIWRSYRKDTENIDKGKSLPDPPNVRENLVQQIKMFIKLHKEKSSRDKRDMSKVLTLRQSSVVNQILKKNADGKLCTRPQSATNPDNGFEAPIRSTLSTPSGRYSACSSRLNDYFVSETDEEKDLSELERLSEVIREELEFQRVEFNDDIEFLQHCLIDESIHRDSVVSAAEEPTLKELSDIGLKLEKELLQKPKGKEYTKLRNQLSSPTKEKAASPLPSAPVVRKPFSMPSPPSSAPTVKTRNNMVHRRHVLTKTFSFPSQETATPTTSSLNTKPQLRNEAAIAYKNASSRILSPTSNCIVSTSGIARQTVASCIGNAAGSNSRKLKELVLESRDIK